MREEILLLSVKTFIEKAAFLLIDTSVNITWHFTHMYAFEQNYFKSMCHSIVYCFCLVSLKAKIAKTLFFLTEVQQEVNILLLVYK